MSPEDQATLNVSLSEGLVPVGRLITKVRIYIATVLDSSLYYFGQNLLAWF